MQPCSFSPKSVSRLNCLENTAVVWANHKRIIHHRWATVYWLFLIYVICKMFNFTFPTFYTLLLYMKRDVNYLIYISLQLKQKKVFRLLMVYMKYKGICWNDYVSLVFQKYLCFFFLIKNMNIDNNVNNESSKSILCTITVAVVPLLPKVCVRIKVFI